MYDDLPIDVIDDEAQAVNPLLIVQRLLRGRMLGAIILGLLCAIPAAFIGYHATKPVYVSNSIINVTPTIPYILGPTDDTDFLRMYNSFVSSQATFVRSVPVLERAVQDPTLIQAGWPAGAQGVERLSRNIEVSHRQGMQTIHVQMQGHDAAIIRDALNAVLRSYERLYGHQQLDVDMRRQEALKNVVDQYSAELNYVRNQILELAQDVGPDAIPELHRNRIQLLEEMRARLGELDRQIIEKQNDPEESEAGMNEELMQKLIVFDNTLESLHLTEARLQRDLAAASLRYGPSHSSVREKELQLEQVSQQRANRERQLYQLGATGVLTSGGQQADPEVEIRRLERLRDQLQEAVVKVQEDASDLGRRRRQVDELQYQAQQIRSDLEQARQRLDSLRVESRNVIQTRISIEQWATLPTSSVSDKRLPFAVLGAGAGMAGGFILVPALAFVRRRYTYSDELDHLHDVELLGVLPTIDRTNLVTQHRAEVAVQHLRNNLQLRYETDHVVVSVLSSEGGEGVTSLVMALAVATAEAGASVVVVDAHLNSPDMTDKMDMGDRQGLRELMAHSDTLDENLIEQCLLSTRYEKVAVLPVGHDMKVDPNRLSVTKTRRLLSRLKQRFDVVLIDAGPVLGHVSSPLFGSVSDQVLMVVRRKQKMGSVSDAVRILHRNSCNHVGVVFNEALQNDPGLRPIYPKPSYLESLPTSETFRERTRPSPMIRVERKTEANITPTNTDDSEGRNVND